MPPPSPRNLPEEEDIFDEEQCRFFLREVGCRVAAVYPFRFGIEEAYGIILDKYKRTEVSDVMSVLEDLLENDATSSGLGDDGDIWRSWRFDWKHRIVSHTPSQVPVHS
jgi:hypothetical protein